MTRKVRGNALTADARKHLIEFFCFEDDYSQAEWPKSQQYAEANRLGMLNNTKFRAEFIHRYGQEWWEDMLTKHC